MMILDSYAMGTRQQSESRTSENAAPEDCPHESIRDDERTRHRRAAPERTRCPSETNSRLEGTEGLCQSHRLSDFHSVDLEMAIPNKPPTRRSRTNPIITGVPLPNEPSPHRGAAPKR